MSEPNKKLVEKVGETIIAAIGVAIAIISLGLLLAWPIKWTWNAAMPFIFALPPITWGKAWCLHFLCASLLKAKWSANQKILPLLADIIVKVHWKVI